MKLIGLDFEIQYKPGVENKVADALSRRDMYCALSVINSEDTAAWIQEVDQDEELQQIKQALVVSPNSHSGYSLKQGLLHFQDKLVLSSSSNRIPLLIAECHTTPTGGHSGLLRTYKRISSFLYWRGMKKDIQQFIAECDVCQKSKYATLAPAGLLQPLPIPTQVWQDMSMDFVTGLPRVRAKDTILVVVDRLTKYAHFLALGHPFTAKDVALLFTSEVIRLHGFPSSIITDRDPIFLSNF